MERRLLFIGNFPDISLDSDLDNSFIAIAQREGWYIDLDSKSQRWEELISSEHYSIVVIGNVPKEMMRRTIWQTISKLFESVGIIVLSEIQDDLEVVVALEIGVDHYLRQPLSDRSLFAHVSSLFRRLQSQEGKGDLLVSPSPYHTSKLAYGSLSIDPKSREVIMDGKMLCFSSSEFDLLYLLAENAGSVVSRQRAMEELRGVNYNGVDRSMDLRISRLRRRLGDHPYTPRKIKTIRGRGYLFNPQAWL